MTERQHVDGFVSTDPMGYVFLYLGAQDQGSLRSSAKMFQAALGAAVNAQIHIGRSASMNKIDKLEDVGTLGSWFPVSEKRCRDPPEQANDQHLGTLVVNPRILFNGAPRIPDGFLEGCVAQSIMYVQAKHITSVGNGWMAKCTSLTSASFEEFTALATVSQMWMNNCRSLTSANFCESHSSNFYNCEVCGPLIWDVKKKL